MGGIRGKRPFPVISQMLDALEQHWQGYRSEDAEISYGGHRFVVQPGVFNGAETTSARLFAEAMAIPPGARVLDMGCGFGPLGIMAAHAGASHVVMLDFSAAAVANTRRNIELNDLTGRAEALESDLFAAVPGRRFDVILFNGPFLSVDPPPASSALYAGTSPGPEAYMDPGYKLFDRFFRDAGAHLEPGGHILFSFGNAGDVEGMQAILDRHGYRDEIVHEIVIDPPGAEFYLLKIVAA
jgi:release factor glutamine methyltransferase